MEALGRAARRDIRVYLVGGTTAVLLGWRPTTIDIDLMMQPEDDALLRVISGLKESLHLNVELASPADFPCRTAGRTAASSLPRSAGSPCLAPGRAGRWSGAPPPRRAAGRGHSDTRPRATGTSTSRPADGSLPQSPYGLRRCDSPRPGGCARHRPRAHPGPARVRRLSPGRRKRHDPAADRSGATLMSGTSRPAATGATLRPAASFSDPTPHGP